MKKNLILLFALLTSSYCLADDIQLGVQAPRDYQLQEKGERVSNYQFQKGDTIIISKATTQYLTGEKPSTFVYYVRHRIQQVGGRRFPDGLLIQGIYSWVRPEDLLLAGAVEKTPEAEAQQKADQQVIQERQRELDEMAAAERQKMEEEARKHRAQLMESARQDSIAKALQDSIAKAYADSVAQAYADSVMQAYQDSLLQAYRDSVEQTLLDTGRVINRFTIGARGGVASIMQNTVDTAGGSWKPGFDVMLDIQYAHYWQKKANKVALGILTGLSVGYSRNAVTSSIDRQYDIVDSDG